MKKNIRYWLKTVVIIGIIILVPFAIEFILFHGPSISHFNNEVWFSFCGSYIGAIITILVLYLTIVNSKKESIREYEKRKIQDSFDEEKKSVNEIVDFLLLNRVCFTDPRIFEMEIANFVHELHATTIKIKYINKDSKEKEDFYNMLNAKCIFYGLHFDLLLGDTAHNKDERYIMTELRKAAHSMREEVYAQTEKYTEYLDKSEKEKIDLLYR